MKRILITVFCLAFGFSLFADYFQLQVGDPRNSWWTDNGTIEEVTMSIRPKGVFTEIGLYLTFSSRETQWTSAYDSLEITLDFSLPKNSIICDSWLWIGEEIVQAEIMDRWTASTIYENIVRRRRDPSVLVKNSPTQYQLRIFPMAGNETRKVKITYLVPSEWTKESVSSVLPAEIIRSSRFLPENVALFAMVNDEWKNPRIMNATDISFESHSDPDFPGYRKAVINGNRFTQFLHLEYDNPMKNGLYLSRFQSGNEGTYQLAFFPSGLVSTVSARKLAILVDYDNLNSGITSKELLLIIKDEMLKNLSPSDSFNLVFSDLSIKRYSEKWVAATASNIEAAFNSLDEPLSDYSNLAPLLANGIHFISENGNDGKIILLSNSDQYGEYQVANKLIYDILDLMNPRIQIHVSDYQSLNYSFHYINGRPYYGNDYLYSNLSRITGGTYQSVRSGYSAFEAIGLSFKYIGGAINSFSLYTSMANGYCHSRYLISENRNIAYITDPIIQVGKYKGDFPFKAEITGEYNNSIFSHQISIPEEDVFEDDSVLQVLWTGQYIHELESDYQNNDIINEIIYKSIEERVLSVYTAFLCLEKDYNPGEDPGDDDIFIDVKNEKAEENSIKAWPNPFREVMNIEIASAWAGDLRELSIYDLSGKMVRSFDVTSFAPGEDILFSWDGRDGSGEEVEAGIYLLVYRTATNSRTMRIMKM